MLNTEFCEIFDIPFFQFSQMKKYCPEDIPIIKEKYKTNWKKWKALNLSVYQNSALILSVILNRKRLQVNLDWHCYRANCSQITLQQWWENLDREKYQDFEIWQDSESEYADFKTVKEAPDLTLKDSETLLVYW